MFGFLPGPCGCATPDSRSAWQSHFCGLCNTLRSRYGLWSRWLINRDSTFLALTGSALATEEPVRTRTTCCNPLGRKRLLVQHEPQMNYAAAVTICGLAEKLRDDSGDERGLRRFAARTGSRLLRRAEKNARADLERSGFPIEPVARGIGAQHDSESPGASLATAGAPTARAYGAVFGHLSRLSATAADTEEPLVAAGAALGRMIYTVDAWEDYDLDRRRRRFNPLPDNPDERQGLVVEAVQTDLGLLGTAFAALPLRRHAPLLLALSGPLLRHRTLTRLGMAGPPPLPPPLPPEVSGPPLSPPPQQTQEPEKKSCGCCDWCVGCTGTCCGCGGKSGSSRRCCCDGVCCIPVPDCDGPGDGCCDCDCDCPCDCG